MAGPIVGAEVVIKIKKNDGTFSYLSGQTNLSFAAQGAEIDASSKDSRESYFLPGRRSETCTIDALYVPGLEEFQVLQIASRNALAIEIMRTELGQDLESAFAIITSMTQNFPDNAPATINLQLRIASPWAGA